MPKTEPVVTTNATSLNDKFSKIGNQILKVAVDFTTLNVTTLTGEYKHLIRTGSGASAKNRINFSDFTKELGASGKTDAKLSLIAHTHIDFDQDTVNFVKQEMTQPDERLFQLHQESIASAHKARQSFIHFLKELV